MKILLRPLNACYGTIQASVLPAELQLFEFFTMMNVGYSIQYQNL